MSTLFTLPRATRDSEPIKTLVRLSHPWTFAGRTAITAVVRWFPGTADEHETETTFIGSATPGFPGPVTIKTTSTRDNENEDGDDEHTPETYFVECPARFGDDFNADWVRAYYA